MAGISTSVGIVDRVSGSLNRITAALYNTTSAFGAVDRASDVAFNPSGVSAMTQEVYRYEQRIQQLESDLVDANERLLKMEEQTKKAAQSADMLKNAFNAVKGVIASAAVKKIIQTSDELVQTTARLNNMNDGLQTTNELVKMVYQSSQNARGSFSDMADVVARFGNNVGIGENSVFKSSQEVVAFAELLQKQMTIAGTGTSEASAAMLQLSQGLGSGVLRGDELNSIFEQAPNLIRNIATYIEKNEKVAQHMANIVGVSYEEMSTNAMGYIRDLAQKGQLSANLVKNAIFSASDDINTQFKEMPKTWGQVWQSMQNTALMKFQPVLEKINKLASSSSFNRLVDGVSSAMMVVANAVLEIFDMVSTIGGLIYDNWSLIAPVVYGVVGALAVYNGYLAITKGLELASAAVKGVLAVAHGIQAAAIWATTSATWTQVTAQLQLNGAMYACPIVWIIILIIALIAAIYAVIAIINKVTNSTISATGVILGALSTAGAAIINILYGLLDVVLQIVNSWYNIFAGFANFFGNLFNDPIGSIIHLFGDMADVVLGIIETIAKAMDKVWGSNLADAVSGWRDSLEAKVEVAAKKHGNGSYEKVMEELNLTTEGLGIKRMDYSDAWDSGYELGTILDEKISDFSLNSVFGAGKDAISQLSGIGGSVDDIVDNTGTMADSVDISNENIKYLRDIAEKEAVNRFTTAEIKVDMTNNNNIASGVDLDGIITSLSDGLLEAMVTTAEGVHV